MKFEKFLNKEAVPEWRPKYLNYHLLKDHLRNIPMNGKNIEIEAEFFLDLSRELKKASAFYQEKEREFSVKWNLFSKLMSKRDLINFYTEIDLVKNFQSLNVTAIKKILKKFIKITANSKMATEFMMGEAEASYFWIRSTILDDLSDKIEEIFKVSFSGGDRHRAMRSLRVRNFKSEVFHASALISGFFWGLSIAGIIYISTLGYPKEHLYILFSLYLPFLAIGLFSINEYVFKSSYVNYRFVFQLDKRSALHECQYFALTGVLSFTFIFSSIFVADCQDTRMLSLPLIIALVLVLNPFPWLWPRSRLWILKTLFRIFSAPFHTVLFKDFFVNDHLISLGLFFQGILKCFGLDSGNIAVKIVPIAPYVPRILQCLRRYHDTRIILNIFNALKYSIALIIILLKPAFQYSIIMTIAQCTSSIFSLYWDIVIDFGFLQKYNFKNILLRRQLVVFRYKIIYYYIIIFNIVSRFTWTANIIYKKPDDFILLIQAMIEVIRRFHWSFLRIEYEHLNNCNAFRAVDDLKVEQVATDDLFYQDMVNQKNDIIEQLATCEDKETQEPDENKDSNMDYEFTDIDSIL